MPLGGALPYTSNTKRPRSSPKERGRVVSDQMSRADSLRSVHEFGTVLSPAEQQTRRANVQTIGQASMNPFSPIMKALSFLGKKNAKPKR